MNNTHSPGKAGNDLAECLKALDMIAVTAIKEGHYEDALACYQQTYDLWTSLGLQKKGAKTLVNIANILVLLERRSEALALLEKAESIFQAEGKRAELQDVMRKCIGIHISDRNLPMAEYLLGKLKSLCSTTNDFGEYSLLQYALLCAKEQDSKGKAMLDRAIQYFETAHNTIGLYRALQLRMHYYAKYGQLKNAELDRIKIATLSDQEQL